MSTWEVSAARQGSYTVRRGAVEEYAGQGLLIVDSGIPRERRERITTLWEPHRVVLASGGESFKNWKTIQYLTNAMEGVRLERRDPVIAVGGGAVLDAAGFAASVYRRGLPYVRVPSTLLAYVDASVGVKTGINVGARKNLIGSFAPPTDVILDPSLLRSLPPVEVSSGLGEVIKLAVGCDPALVPLLQNAHPTGEWIASLAAERLLDTSIAVMLRELQPNLYEGDLTRAVDLGHTFGIALEMRGMRHGESVALDVLLSATLSQRRGILSDGDVAEVISMISTAGLPLRPTVRCSPAELYESLDERRRHRGGDQRVPLPAVLGSCIFADDVTLNELAEAATVAWS